ncbi:hypothetical protein HRR83_001789 [Exophiala dermatitidis]|uniref:Uncharacterized protein n=1 Tax=Exophiala dermatitidis TaxID=5970 RepID=A0AAN6F1H3_EXODE|nr:hypothetical protein HRR73_004920 [Exophiala dermatitidis]KAJ4526592.1 hypothetical protein HRR74_001792 [Exophiala dermatitidis]KAJ4567559.1 hypothetical protein HRR79_005073 [Exophiala dermatitidis]KAJ4580825.1 hypothetical protein HRR82_004488 [Exophiala dermatitidis]KAJ4594700.1 hypothetical protein HRR84_005974 [Exophiala dermatitidis]
MLERERAIMVSVLWLLLWIEASDRRDDISYVQGEERTIWDEAPTSLYASYAGMSTTGFNIWIFPVFRSLIQSIHGP